MATLSLEQPASAVANRGVAYQLKVFRGLTGLQQLAGEWDHLLARTTSSHFFHQRQWFESYLHSLEAGPDRMVFSVIYDGDEPIALLPLKEERRTIAGPIKVRTLELPRHDHLHLRDILLGDSARQSLSLSTIVQQLRACRELKWDMLCLWHAMDDSCVMSAQRLGAPRWTICQPRFECSTLAIQPWEQMQKNLSKSFRQNLRTANNRAKAVEGLRIETIDTLPQLESAMEAFIEVEGSGWKTSTGTAIRQDDRLKAFYLDLVRRFGATNQCEIHLLRHGDKPIGGLFVLLTQDRFYFPKVAYDEEHSRISPVQLLIEHAMKRYSQRPEIRELNLTSDAGWFDVWKPVKSPVWNVYAFNTTPIGLAAAMGMRVANKLHEMRSKPSPQSTAESTTSQS